VFGAFDDFTRQSDVFEVRDIGNPRLTPEVA